MVYSDITGASTPYAGSAPANTNGYYPGMGGGYGYGGGGTGGPYYGSSGAAGVVYVAYRIA